MNIRSRKIEMILHKIINAHIEILLIMFRNLLRKPFVSKIVNISRSKFTITSTSQDQLDQLIAKMCGRLLNRFVLSMTTSVMIAYPIQLGYNYTDSLTTAIKKTFTFDTFIDVCASACVNFVFLPMKYHIGANIFYNISKHIKYLRIEFNEPRNTYLQMIRNDKTKNTENSKNTEKNIE